ncbi:MAG: mucoidy inhibitor MuiA family protein [Bacteroidia bacterium]|jgi:uncharacterized protein (TIGR02231 family)
MKTYSFLFQTYLFLLITIPSIAANTFKAKVEKATVYLNGAQLFSSHDVSLLQGVNEIIFEGVSPLLQAPSLQASGKGSFTIMEVRFDAIYPEAIAVAKPSAKKVKSLQLIGDSITEITLQLDEIADKMSALQTEKNILLNNRLIKGETKRDTLNLFKDAMEYLRNRLSNLNAETYKLKREQNLKNQLLTELQERQNQLSALINQVDNTGKPAPQANHRVIVSVLAEQPCVGSVSINYFVAEAGWTPEYDLRADNNTNKLQLTHKARITQNTGVDWNNAYLTLATGTPMQSTIKPNLAPAYLSFYNAYQQIEKKKALSETPKTLSFKEGTVSSIDKGNRYDDDMKDAVASYDWTAVSENILNTEYDVKLRYNIPADGKQHLVAIQTKDLKTNYNLSSVPKLDASAYLLAKITGWEDLNLIPGNSRIYFDGTYIGESFIDPNTTNDTLELSMGRDRGIVVQRKKLKDKTKEKVLLEEKTISVTYEIMVKNTKSVTAELHIDDQIPLSSNPGIVVKLTDSSKAKYDVETGKLSWDINLKPKESRKISFTYEVKIPKDKMIAGI